MKKLFICLYLLLTSSIGYSEVNCVQTPYGIRCDAQVPKELAHIATSEVGGQHMTNWCWAASMETVFFHWGFDVPQQQIVVESFGRIENLPAKPWKIMNGLNREWFDLKGRSFISSAKPVNFLVDAAHELENDRPVIIGYSNSQIGHAVVLESISTLKKGNGPLIPTGAWVSDPWPGRGIRPLESYEYQNITFSAAVEIEETPTSSNRIFEAFERRYPNYFPPSTSHTQTAQYKEGNTYYRWYANGRGLYAYRGDLHFNLGNGKGWQYSGTLQEANQHLCNNGCF